MQSVFDRSIKNYNEKEMDNQDRNISKNRKGSGSSSADEHNGAVSKSSSGTEKEVIDYDFNYRQIIGDDTLVDESDGTFGQLCFAFSFDSSNVAKFLRIILKVKGRCACFFWFGFVCFFKKKITRLCFWPFNTNQTPGPDTIRSIVNSSINHRPTII